MTHLLSAFILCFSSNVDNFAVAVAYGVKNLRIGRLSNLLIALVSALGTLLSLSVGEVIGRYLSDQVANFLGSGVLIAIGIWGIWDTLERERKRQSVKMRQTRSRSLVAVGMDSTQFVQSQAVESSSIDSLSYESFLENPEKADTDQSGYIDVREAIAIAFGLTINNLGTGVGAGISDFNVPFTTGLTFAFSVMAVSGGYYLGDRFTTRITGISAGVVSGLMVIALGIYEYFIP
ncbi:manganese efflux pump [Leptolyngbya sp. NIES-2104]|uniref:manganese efflux pump n=1 Tax=Leptolyngbya sp. NIES-2104 TaxID=1552121 RepID=UPI0006EC98BF|nr:manganese efflux pump [Leptolyngbya sp. NIES-2104]GAP94847.1 membrane protein, putative [Leptolyngbya sp. NIES-2104]